MSKLIEPFKIIWFTWVSNKTQCVFRWFQGRKHAQNWSHNDMQDGMPHFAFTRSAKTPEDALICIQDVPKDNPKTASWPPKTAPRRAQDVSRRSPMPSGRFKLCPAAPEAVQKPSRPRFWTRLTSILHSPDVNLGGPTEPKMIPKSFTNDIKDASLIESTVNILVRWRLKKRFCYHTNTVSWLYSVFYFSVSLHVQINLLVRSTVILFYQLK